MRISACLMMSLSIGVSLPLCQAQDFGVNITQNGPNFDFEWTSQAGKFYRLWSSSDLSETMTNASLVVEDLVGVGSVGATSILRPADDRLFYWMEEYPEPLIQIEMVTVDNLGNAPDPILSNRLGKSGAVDYEYKIGKYEITNQEYVTFLNAVDPLGGDSLDLYKSSMATDVSNGGITVTLQNFDGKKYEAKLGFETKPVSYVDLYDAIRFCNWLHNGAQVGGDTEDGAYTLVGGTPSPTNGETVMRNPGARFTVPSENEWYKAAYHQPANDGGDIDDYWRYPTGTNQSPTGSGPSASTSSANYARALIGVTDVGAYPSTVGYYGTFDMAGNLSEWTDAIEENNGTLFRVLRGGAWNSNPSRLESNGPVLATGNTNSHIHSFRISSH